MHRKNMKRTVPILMAAALTVASVPMAVQADSSNVVTLGANLSEEQKTSMYEYFGTSADEVATIEVTNADERKYMEGIASEEQIGTRTYSCSYVQPTSSGGIQVKVANLTYVTSSMIASTLTTSGVENCNVVAASPIAVSGTGALTGIMMAYEKASGETLDEGQKEAATQELITTGELADSVGQEAATGLMNDVKQEVIEDGLTDTGEIQDAVDKAADTYNITLTEDQMNQIVSLMESISQYDYDVKALKNTLENLSGESGGFFSNLWSSIKGIFTGDSGDGGIINDTQDDLLGTDAVIDSTLDAVESSANDAEEEGGFWNKIVGFFEGLFGGDDADEDAGLTEETTDENTEDTAEDPDSSLNNSETESDMDNAGSDTSTDPQDSLDSQDGSDTSDDPATDSDGASDSSVNSDTDQTLQ